MKLIATRNFRNTHNIDLDGNGKITADEHFVAKGTVFHIGGKKPFDECSKADQAMIALLNHSKCIADANDEKITARIKAELAEEKKVEQRAANTAVAAGSAADLVKQLTEALAALSGKGKAAA